MTQETPQQADESPKIETAEDTAATKLELDDLTKAAAILVGSLYVIGVLATNTYLYSLGVTDFSLLKARYIYTGALALIPIFLATLGPVFGIHFFHYRPGLPVSESVSTFDRTFTLLMNSRLASWEMLIIGFGLPFVAFYVFTFAHAEGDIIAAIGLALWMYLVCFGAGMFGTATIAAALPKAAGMRLLESIFPRKNKESSRPKPVPVNEPPNWVSGFGLALFTVGYFSFYLSLFGSVILPQVPEQFGGAKPHQGQLLFTADAVQGAQELGVEIEEGKLVSQEMTILFEGENIIVVGLPDGHILQLRKDMLQAVYVDLSELNLPTE